MRYFWLKNRKSRRALGAPPPDLLASGVWGLTPSPPASGGWVLRLQTPLASGGWGLRPQTPRNSPPMTNSWLRACCRNENLSLRRNLFYLLIKQRI